MSYIDDKLDGLSYNQLEWLLKSLDRDIKSFKLCLANPPLSLTGLKKMVVDEISKRADLIPSEKLMFDLEFSYTLIN